MDRRTFLFVFSLGALRAPLAAEAQPVGKVHRIGYLVPGSSTDRRHLTEAFRQGLRELGWVEGQNIVIDYRFAEGRFDRLPEPPRRGGEHGATNGIGDEAAPHQH